MLKSDVFGLEELSANGKYLLQEDLIMQDGVVSRIPIKVFNQIIGENLQQAIQKNIEKE